jgi:UDP-N-acetylglucosamine 2-epimerase
MSKYRVTLTIHETAAMSKEDFRKLQEAVNQIAEVTEFRMILDNEAVNASNVATFMQMIPKDKLGFKFIDPVTPRDITGHDLPEDEKALSSHN